MALTRQEVEAALGHHQDYSKPTEVVWLCSRHHSQLHNGLFELIPKVPPVIQMAIDIRKALLEL